LGAINKFLEQNPDNKSAQLSRQTKMAELNTLMNENAKLTSATSKGAPLLAPKMAADVAAVQEMLPGVNTNKPILNQIPDGDGRANGEASKNKPAAAIQPEELIADKPRVRSSLKGAAGNTKGSAPTGGMMAGLLPLLADKALTSTEIGTDRSIEDPTSPEFAERRKALQNYDKGGVQEGQSYVGDRVDAKINSGEMVLNLDQQQRLLDVLRGHARPAEIKENKEDIVEPADKKDTNLHERNKQLEARIKALEAMRK
jgi:hypothetical protein